MLMIQMVLSLFYICIMCGTVTAIVCHLALWALGKALEFEEEFERMDDDFIVDKNGNKIPYDEDTQE